MNNLSTLASPIATHCRRDAGQHLFKSPNTKPLRDFFCNAPINMPEALRDLLDRVNLGCTELKSRNAKLLAMVLLALREISPADYNAATSILKEREVAMVHAFIQRFAAGTALVVLCSSLFLQVANGSAKQEMVRARAQRVRSFIEDHQGNEIELLIA